MVLLCYGCIVPHAQILYILRAMTMPKDHGGKGIHGIVAFHEADPGRHQLHRGHRSPLHGKLRMKQSLLSEEDDDQG